MRKSLLITLLLVLCVLLCACGKKTEAPVQVETTPVPTAEPTKSPEMLYSEEVAGMLPTDGTVGTYLQDLDGNGVNELFVGPLTGDIYERQIINAMYTVCDGEVTEVLKSTDKDKYYLTENGTVAEEIIKSAFESRYNYYTYSNGELKLMTAVGFDMATNREMPWYEEEAGQRNTMDEQSAMNIIQLYQSTYRNLEYN